MKLKTKHFGDIEVDEKRILTFNDGIPGFEDVIRYTIIHGEDEDSPFKWLQGIDKPELAFALVDPFAIKHDYDIILREDVKESLGIENREDVLVYSIVVVPDDVCRMTMNLKAPIIINKKSNRGMQIVLDEGEYGVRHYIMEELQRREVVVNACSYKKEGSDYSCK